ncbi:hypothetical protein F5B22DRAFT_72521 [Xylaria bambusicola]|uniref:uncharacterized protein n=1 Tax=Xylaria bambusicola TaxID=326684 RepID=UPI0020081A46|nr:uncharacterized protein F5B22DRAFT_72521 [Xylaria bambusicola]KAI0518587.1 hypothetical protein F5B22DRAFT_72521 [Xylaria bambusicola]
MPDNNSVALQADVVNLASITHLITGRILKALSDGGVDIYAVAASIWLGKQFKVKRALESTVHSHLASRKGINGFLAKALHIGWGHSEVAVEMSRTRAGTNALLLIGALSVGTPYFEAARCLSELLAISGCEPDRLPNVDVLKPMIAYLGPFMADIGFAKVLQHITTTAEHASIRSRSHSPKGLQAIGDAPVLAGAIKQLIVTSERKESIYMVAQQRGAWLAAFASHILGMSVELIYDEDVLWASGGDGGHVVLQLASTYTGGTIQRSSDTHIQIISPPSSGDATKHLSIDYALSDALEAELGRYPKLTPDMIAGVHRAICHMTHAILKTLRMKSSSAYETTHQINGPFEKHDIVLETFAQFKIQPPTRTLGLEPNQEGWAGSAIEQNGLRFLEYSDAKKFREMCHIHKLGAALGRCTCCHIGALIHGFASSIAALVQCRYEPDQIRVQVDIIRGAASTSWSRGCIGEILTINSRQLLSHILQLVGGDDADVVQENSILQLTPRFEILGLSGGAYTIFYACILQEDCYDDSGRILMLSPGRVSVNGTMRGLITERVPKWDSDQPTAWPAPYDRDVRERSDDKFSVLAAGSYIESHYAPSRYHVVMHAFLAEHDIFIHTSITLDASHTYLALISRAVHNLLTIVHVPRACHHPIGKPYQVLESVDLVVSPFAVIRQDFDSTMLMTIKDNKFEQLMQIGTAGPYVLQIYSCLECAVKYAINSGIREVGFSRWRIIMIK